MSINVGPNTPNPTHHIKLSLSGTEVGGILVDYQGNPDETAYSRDATVRKSLQTFSGAAEYEDAPLPWTEVPLKDWSGGMGQEDFEDKSKYADGYRVGTTKYGELIAGGLEQYAKGIRNSVDHWPIMVDNNSDGVIDMGVRYTEKQLSAAVGYTLATAYKVVPVADITVKHIQFQCSYIGSPNSLKIAICNDNSGSPGTERQSTTIAYTDLDEERFYYIKEVTLATATTLSASTAYWVKFEVVSKTISDIWYILADLHENTTSANWKYTSNGGTSWSAEEGGSLFVRLLDAHDNYNAHFCLYKGALFAGIEYLDGGLSKVFMNGDQGVVSSVTGSGTITTIGSGTATWAADEAIGAIIKIVAGTGSEQKQNWREIIDNGATATGATAFTHAAWDDEPSTDSIVVIIGTNKWTEIDTTTAPSAGAGWTNEVIKGVCSVNQIMYWLLGDGTNYYRHRRYNASGTWTDEWEQEADAFTFMIPFVDQDGAQIVGAKGGVPARYKIADAVNGTGNSAMTGSGNDLSFGDANNAGDLGARIRGGCRYGEYGNVYLGKEDGIYEIMFGTALERVTFLDSTIDDRNGVGMLKHQGALYTSWHDTTLRFYPPRDLTNVGPNTRTLFLPSDRRGASVARVSYVDYMFEAIDGGEEGYSSILCYNEQGWHEMWRAPETGMRISNLIIQSIPENNVDQLWFSCGSDILWVPLSIDPVHHPTTTYHFYAYTFGSRLETSWIYSNRYELEKLWSKIRLIMEGSGYYGQIQVFYKLDEDSNWTLITGLTSFNTEGTVSSSYDAVGRRVKFLFMCKTGLNWITPRLKIAIVKALVDENFGYESTFTMQIDDEEKSLDGQYDSYDVGKDKLTQIRTWANSVQPVLLNCSMDDDLDGTYVKIHPPTIKVISRTKLDNRIRRIIRFSVTEVG